MSDKRKRDFKRLVERTKRNAYNNGQPWGEDDLDILGNGIKDDDTTYDMAMRLGRSYWAVQTRRAYWRFAMDNYGVISRFAEAEQSNVTPINRKKA